MFQNIYVFWTAGLPWNIWQRVNTNNFLSTILLGKYFRNRELAFVSRASLELWFRSNVLFLILRICLFAILPLFAFLLKLVLVGGGLVGRLLETSPDLWLLPFVHCLQAHPLPLWKFYERLRCSKCCFSSLVIIELLSRWRDFPIKLQFYQRVAFIHGLRPKLVKVKWRQF